MSTARVKKRITPTSVVPVPTPSLIYDQKLLNQKPLSPASEFLFEVKKQLYNNSKKINAHDNEHDNKMILRTIHKIFNPHHLTEKSRIIRNKKSKKGGKTRRRRNNNK
jgi:hypothetical protein